MNEDEKYEKLQVILDAAAKSLPPGDAGAARRTFLTLAGGQSSGGKGVNRHANDRAWEDQPILTIQRAVGTGFAIGQAMKKVQEAERMPVDRALEELKGAIVYLAGFIRRAHEIFDDSLDHTIPDPGAMAEIPEFQDALRSIHQVMFCAGDDGTQEMAAGLRAINAIAQLAVTIQERALAQEAE